MQGTSGIAPPAGGVRPIACEAWRGLVQVLSGSDPPPRWCWRPPWQRWIIYTVLGTATLLLGAASIADLVVHAAVHQAGGRTGLAAGHGLPPGAGTKAPSPGSPGQSYRISHTAAAIHLPPWVPGGATALWVLAALGVVVPTALAIRHPLLGWRIGWLALLLVPLLDAHWWGGLPWDPVQILVLLAVLCAAGIRHGRRALCWLWALTLVPWWFWMVRDGLSAVTAALGSVAFGAIAVAVDSVGSRQRAQAALTGQTEAAEVERARRAVLEERTRIARELHDVVAHHMSLMAIRAESAPHRLGKLPDPVRAEFGRLSGSARDALADMRRLLSVLRSDQPAARAPQPGLPDLPGLIDTTRQAGMAVEMSPLPAPDHVPPSAGVCAYRIIQEALSNAGRHAAGAPVTVSVRHDADTLTLSVTNGPQTPAKPRTNGHRPGHGLAGMQERAELLGGSLSAGRAPDGGFAVSAVLPLSGSAA
jgi:signal transduction histidine kinase